MKSPLTIGIDFDNTIVLYDELFYQCALEESLIPPDIAKEKRAIRDEIRRLPQGNDRWTVLQSIVYGQRMHEAKLADGFQDFMCWAKKAGHSVYIISHKTQYPAMGAKVDLRFAALKWMQAQGFFNPESFGLNVDNDVFFEDTLPNKLHRISAQKCTHFIDDLEEVLCHSNFPKDVKRIHYTNTATNSNVSVCATWAEVLNLYLSPS